MLKTVFDPYYYPLGLSNTMNILVHSVCAIMFHAGSDMGIRVQSERRRGMTKVFLDCLDIVAGLNAVHCEGVSQVMKALRPKHLLLCYSATIQSQETKLCQ